MYTKIVYEIVAIVADRRWRGSANLIEATIKHKRQQQQTLFYWQKNETKERDTRDDNDERQHKPQSKNL